MSRYCIGIDLGTTNTAVSYVDAFTSDDEGGVSEVFPVKQYIGEDRFEKRSLVQSALLYTPGSSNCDFPSQWIVGSYAYQQQPFTPQLVVTSSKSWLCHGGVDREAAILPWGSTEVPHQDLISPVQAAVLILSQIRDAWNEEFASDSDGYRFEDQKIVITVPASFDADAQALTLRAAKAIGLQDVRLLEEPQAALYRWIERDPRGLKSGTVLVCDVGGGTADFSLFHVRNEAGQMMEVDRIAVGEHLLLGGDNIDAGIAATLTTSFEAQVKREASPSEHITLRVAARRLKEDVLAPHIMAPDEAPDELSISIPVAGRSLFGGTISLRVDCNAIRQEILEGFFPRCDIGTEPLQTRGALRDTGLPYARDPRITAHLAAFVRGHAVDAVLFNGGTLQSSLIRDRILDSLESWQGERPVELDGAGGLAAGYDSAVSQGAAWYAAWLARKGRALILGGYPRTLYLELFRKEVGSERQLLCVVPKGFSEQEAVVIPIEGLEALVNQQVRFQLWSSITRSDDRAGDVIPLEAAAFHRLPPLAVQLSFAVTAAGRHIQQRIPIKLFAHISETGLCVLECRADRSTDPSLPEQRWELEFNLRGQVEENPSDNAREMESPFVQACLEEIDAIFGRRKSGEVDRTPKNLMKSLERLARKDRSDWDIAFMRSLWPPLARGITRRSRSVEHESAWFGAAGYILRPGFGAPLDEARISEAWRVYETGLAFPREGSVKAASIIFWRRIAGGLEKGKQAVLYADFMREVSKLPPHTSELVRSIASLTRLGIEEKEEIFRMIVGLLKKGRVDHSAAAWSLQRLLSRTPVFAELDTVVPGTVVAGWLLLLGEIDIARLGKNEWIKIYASVAQRTGDVRRDLQPSIREECKKRLMMMGATAELLRSLDVPVELSVKEIGYLLGDAIPAGITLSR